MQNYNNSNCNNNNNNNTNNNNNDNNNIKKTSLNEIYWFLSTRTVT